ncbi:MAG: hypothetical protein ACOY31_03670 [Bacillota bacterium]
MELKQTYKGIEIYKDNLGRWCTYNPESKYSVESDHRKYGTLKEAKEAINKYRENGYWE